MSRRRGTDTHQPSLPLTGQAAFEQPDPKRRPHLFNAMNLDQLLEYVLSKPEAEETLPFGPDVLVVKVRGKAFILIPLDAHPLQFNLKCDPERAIELREEHAAIVPGYHMNKRHWNTLVMDGTLPPSLVRELIDHSYELVAGCPDTKKPKKGS